MFHKVPAVALTETSPVGALAGPLLAQAARSKTQKLRRPCYIGHPRPAPSGVCGLPVGDGANPSMRCRSRAGAADLGGERHLKWAKLPGSARPRLPTRRSFDSPAHTGLGARIGARLRLLSLKDAAGRATRSNRGLPGVRHRAEGPPCRRAEARLDRGARSPFSLWAPCCFRASSNPGDPPHWRATCSSARCMAPTQDGPPA